MYFTRSHLAMLMVFGLGRLRLEIGRGGGIGWGLYGVAVSRGESGESACVAGGCAVQ